MNDNAVYGAMLFVLAIGLICGAALGWSYCGEHGTPLGTVTATEGMLTVTGEARVAIVDGQTVLVVENQQGAARSTSYLRKWELITRDSER